MAITNHDRVGKALELLTNGLKPFIERELKSVWGDKFLENIKALLSDTRLQAQAADGTLLPDVAALLVIMDREWKTIFSQTLGKAERSMVNEVLDVRNKWAHQRPFSTDDAYRALDSVSRLLTSISAAAEADEVERVKQELLRLKFDEQVRSEKRRSASTALEGQPVGNLKPWREVVTPHSDVAKGSYQQAEFAADLWQVYLGEGGDEYRDPVEFFRRTFLTESLKSLLTGALQRLGQNAGDPVVQLQTNFGGGKTHSMLALYHLFSGRPVADLPGLEVIQQKSGISKIPPVKRVVIVGNKISPGNPQTKPDGTVVRTLWGELAWQLGGKKAYALVAADDEKATSPGHRLHELFNKYGPCLILIDEWVAYARQLHDSKDLPGGDFETHFTFAQTLTEAAKTAKNTLLVVSLPASESNATSPHAQSDDVEVGGERGRAALDRLRNAIGRVESSWRPANQDEGFEIVRRRLFTPLVEQAQFVARDTTVKAFAELYRTQHQEFPPECRDSDYERRMKLAYPIHPEVFERLYADWSTLVKFQRTRGVLRLMAAVIHALWEKGDRNPLILPAHIPIDEPRVQFELTRYLPDQWVPVIEKDVDGPNSLPLRMDGEQPNLGKYSACRRVARTIYLGSAPTANAANRGLEDRRVKLGCVLPGEAPTIFGDALRRLSAAATYLYHDGTRYWYSTQPTVTKLAEDRAEQLKSNPDAVAEDIKRRVKLDVRQSKGEFSRVHDFPASNADVPDDADARLVILGVEYPYTKDADNPAVAAAKVILDSRGSSPRLLKNTLAFLASDKTKLSDLDEAVRRFLAWESIVNESQELNLDPQQQKNAKTQLGNADKTVASRLPECYQWLLAPTQTKPQDAVEWSAFRLTGTEPLAARASRKMKTDEMLVVSLAATRLRIELDNVPLWRGDNVAVKTLIEDFARYTYLPRLRDSGVLIDAIAEGLSLLTWHKESFAYADDWDEEAQRYRGLRCGQHIAVTEDSTGLLVKPEPALHQYEAERPPMTGFTSATITPGGSTSTTSAPGGTPPLGGAPAEPPKPKRFHGTVQLDPQRVGRDAGTIAQEVVSHLAGIIGADVKVTIEIDAIIPAGAPEQVVRAVTENCRTLKFTSQGFESE
jgi:predicted AAA+ superfamily ATPase